MKLKIIINNINLKSTKNQFSNINHRLKVIINLNSKQVNNNYLLEKLNQSNKIIKLNNLYKFNNNNSNRFNKMYQLNNQSRPINNQ